MDYWPPLTDPHLLRRLNADEPEFQRISLELAAYFGNREFDRERFDRALRYPFERPEVSFRMIDGAVELLDDAAELSEDWSEDARFPVLTIGSNGSPGVLARKLSGLPEDARDVVVLTGEFIDHEIAPCAHVALYGSVPATISPAPGVRVRAGLILATAAQTEVLAHSEIPYALVRIDDAPFIPDLDLPAPESVFGFVARTGALELHGQALALAAIPAAHRTARAVAQKELLGEVAALLELPDAETLVRRVFADYEWATRDLREVLAGSRREFNPDDWNCFSS